MTRRLAIIPARGGSKRLPHKNILPFLGRPIIAHTIEAATESGCFKRILVSTEDVEIADAARAAGAEIHQRDPSLATDAATLTDVCLDILASEERQGRSFDTFACLYATAPLRRADALSPLLRSLSALTSTIALAVTTYLRSDKIGRLVVDNGSTNAAKVKAFRMHRTFYGPRFAGHVMPRERSVDIDEQSDYDLACWYANKLGYR